MRIKRCGFCGLPRHGTRNGYQRCIRRAFRLAVEVLQVQEWEAVDRDECLEGSSYVGFAYRPGLAARRERGQLEDWREPAFPGQSVPGSDAAGREGREPRAAEQAGRFGPRQEPR